MILRGYRPEDCEKLASLFRESVCGTCARDYTPEELDAWAGTQPDIQEWNLSFLEHFTIVAEEDGQIVGFGDIAGNGYLDRLFVHPKHQGAGVATAICDLLEVASSGFITTRASRTARPFFERRGYNVQKRLQVPRNGQVLTAYLMTKRR